MKQYSIRVGSGSRTYTCLNCGYSVTGTWTNGGSRRISRLTDIKQHARACFLKASPEHQAQMKWARNVVSGIVIPPASK